MLVRGTAEGLAGAASDAWDHKARTAGEFGLSGGIGALFSAARSEAGLPKVVLELGVLALGVSTAIQFAKDGTRAFSAIEDAWHSPQNLAQDRAALAGTVGPLLFNAALTSAGGAFGAGLGRTVPVAWKENALLRDLQQLHPESAAHSVRVGEWSRLTASEMGLSRAAQSEVYHSGLMHDIGKLRSPVELLSKPTDFTPAEWDVIRHHPIDSFDILHQVPYKGNLRNVPANTLMHHEWLDGTGYPYGLSGDKISVPARVVPPVDVFDAVTEGRKYSASNRAYAERMPLPKVKQLIDGGIGRHFDPAAVEGLWNIRADRALKVLESGPFRERLPSATLRQFKSTTLGRLLEVMNGDGKPATSVEQQLAQRLNEIYNLPNKS